MSNVTPFITYLKHATLLKERTHYQFHAHSIIPSLFNLNHHKTSRWFRFCNTRTEKLHEHNTHAWRSDESHNISFLTRASLIQRCEPQSL